MKSSRWAIAQIAFLLFGGPALFASVAGAPRPSSESSLSTASLDQIVRGVESHYRDVRTLKGQFTQTYSWGDTKRTESGVAYFSRGGLMRWVYLQPKDKLVVSDGKTVWLYLPDDKQVTRSSPKVSPDVRIPFPLLVSHFNLHRIFSKIEFADQTLKAEPGDRVMRGYPKKGFEDIYSEILLEVAPSYELKRMVVFYPDRSAMQFDFDGMERNIPLRSELFRFTPPPGTQVIDE